MPLNPLRANYRSTGKVTGILAEVVGDFTHRVLCRTIFLGVSSSENAGTPQNAKDGFWKRENPTNLG